MSVKKQIRYRLARIKHRWWAWQNWRNGYKFGAIRRFRCCDHTTPFHYANCAVGYGDPLEQEVA